MNKMEYANTVANMIMEETEIQVIVRPMQKNNGIELLGLTIVDPDSNVSPTIYIEQFMDKEPSETVSEMLRIYSRNRMERISEDFFYNYSNVKENLTLRVLNQDKNNMKDYPFIPVVGDVVAVLIINLNDGTIKVTKELLNIWGVDETQVFRQAMKNVDSIIRPVIRTMNDVIKEMMLEKVKMGLMSKDEYEEMSFMLDMQPSPLYVVGNVEGKLGANQLCNKKLLDAFYKEFGDFIIIPSSIHECIFCPMKFGVEKEELMEMIHFVNANEVDPEEYLSDMAFIYDGNQLSVY